METLNLQITEDSSKAADLYYCVSLKTPPKPELLNLIPFHMEKLEYSIKFKTGILATLAHSITLCIFREFNDAKICIFISLESSTGQIIKLRAIEINFSTTNGDNAIYSMNRRLPPADLQIPKQAIIARILSENCQCWMANSEWPNDTAALFITFNITRRSTPKIIDEEEETCSQIQPFNGCIAIENHFMNEEFSDFTIICQGKMFPVHRIVLSSRVKYFDAMFTSNMKEAQEGKLTVDDISPTSCEEMLRFIYQGRVENMSGCAHELFILADKLGMTDLQGLCERYLFQNLSVDNAVEFYDLSPALSKKAKEIILRICIFSNKNTFAPDPEAFKNFTCKHPELVFELFKMS